MFYRKVQYELTDDGLLLVDFEPSSYEGVADLCKKGGNQKRVGREQEALAKSDIDTENLWKATQARYQGYSDPFMQSLISTIPGQMSPYAAAQYGSDVENIGRTYQNLRQAGFKALGARGFGNAPAGMESSMTNTLNDQEGRALTGAYRGGLDRTLGEGITAADYFQKGQQIYDPTKMANAAEGAFSGSTASYDAADKAAAQSWKTGIGLGTGIASMFVPGVGLLGGLNKLGKGGGGSSYGQPTWGGVSSEGAPA